MSKVLFSDNAATVLATGIGVGATGCTVSGGTGAEFPSPNPTIGTYFFLTFVAAANVNVKEIVRCTQRTTDTFVITPTVNAWLAGDTVQLSDPAEAFEQLAQFDDLQAQAGNYALDTGAANAYVVSPTPAIGTPIPGAPIRWLAGHSNTGPSTFNGQPLVLHDGSALAANDVVAEGIYTSTWNTALVAYQLDGVVVTSFGQLAGTIGNAQVPVGAVLQFLAQILNNAALTGDPTAPTAAPGTNTTQIASTAFATAVALAAAAGLFSVSLTNPGHFAIGGMILQFGTINTTTNAGAVAVNFGQTFPNGLLSGVFTQVVCPAGTGGAGSYAHQVSSESDSGFVYSTGASVNNAMTLNWLVIGW